MGLSAAAACGADDGDPGDPVCVPTGAEQVGDGADNDCDGLFDEAKVCASGGDYATIAAAVAAAPDGTGIELCPGTYAEHLTITGKAIGIGGPGAATTILDGGGVGPVVTVTGGGALTLIGLTVRNGVTSGSGGGVLCDASTLTMNATALVDNRAATGGGGLYARACTVQLDGVRLANNEGTSLGGGALLVDSTGEIAGGEIADNAADDGGGLHVFESELAIRGAIVRRNLGRVHGGALYLAANTLVEDSDLSENRSNWTGGGIYVDHHAPTIQRNTIRANVAVEEGGGVYAHESQLVVTDNQITFNQATDDGGGVRLFTCAARVERNLIANNRSGTDGGGLKSSHLPSVIADNEIVDNEAAWSGGGIELDNDASLVRGGLIARNRAPHGAGIHAMLSPWNDGVIEDVRLIDNRASKGGALYFEDNFQPYTVRRVTVQGNTAIDGAGLYVRTSQVTVTNSLFTGNSAGGDGGALWLGRPDLPWADECPCPPSEPSLRVEFSVLAGNSAPTGAAAWTSVSGLTVESTIVDGNTGIGVAATAGAVPTWRYNDTAPASFSGLADPTGVDGNLAVAPDFLDVGAGDFRLREASVCIDAGNPAHRDRDGSRADMGLYAGPNAP